MGVVKKILGVREVDPVSTFYSGYAALEIAESIHLHWRNTRIEFDAAEFEQFCKMVGKSYLTWLNLGKVASTDPAKMIFLKRVELDEVPSRLNPEITSDQIRFEVQQWADYIHFHWKWLRLELSFDEFIELAELMNESLARFRSEKWFLDAPRRIGKNHRAIPFGRVDKQTSDEFWVHREDAHAWIGYETYYLDGEDKVLKEERGRMRKRTQAVLRERGVPSALNGHFNSEIARELVKLLMPRPILRVYRWIRSRIRKS